MTADSQAPPRAAGDDAPGGGERSAARRRGSSEAPRLRGGFGRAAGWSVLGTLVPGSGLINAGRRAWGWVALVPFLLAVGAGVAVLVSGTAVAVARRWVFQPQAMLVAAVAAGVVGLLWCLVVVGTHRAQRRARGVRRHRVASTLLVVLLLAVVAVPSATAARYALSERALLMSVFGAQQRPSGQSGPDTTASDPWAGTPRVNVMLLGADSSQMHVGLRPDTLMVASINTRTGDTVLVSLPRQLEGMPFTAGSPAAALWPTACRAEGNGCMLNAVYQFGVNHPELYPGAKDPGLAATREAVSSAVGLPIDYTAMVNLDGFQHLIDALGGITLTVPRPYPIGGGHILTSSGRDTGRTYPITGWVPAGQDVHLDGYQAEWYARSRADSDNTDRMDRQRCLINAAVKQYSVFDLARAFPALAATAQQDVATDIPASELNAFIDLGLKVKSAPLRTLNIDIGNTDTGDPDYAALHALVQQALVPPAPAPATPSPSATPTPTPGATATPSAPAPAATPDPGAAVDADSVCPS